MKKRNTFSFNAPQTNSDLRLLKLLAKRQTIEKQIKKQRDTFLETLVCCLGELYLHVGKESRCFESFPQVQACQPLVGST